MEFLRFNNRVLSPARLDHKYGLPHNLTMSNLHTIDETSTDSTDSTGALSTDKTSIDSTDDPLGPDVEDPILVSKNMGYFMTRKPNGENVVSVNVYKSSKMPKMSKLPDPSEFSYTLAISIGLAVSMPGLNQLQQMFAMIRWYIENTLPEDRCLTIVTHFADDEFLLLHFNEFFKEFPKKVHFHRLHRNSTLQLDVTANELIIEHKN